MWRDERRSIEIAMDVSRRCGGHEVHPIKRGARGLIKLNVIHLSRLIKIQRILTLHSQHGIGRIPSSGTGISRYHHTVPSSGTGSVLDPSNTAPGPPLIRYCHPELDDGFRYWILVIGYRYQQIPVPDDGPDDDRRTLIQGTSQLTL